MFFEFRSKIVVEYKLSLHTVNKFSNSFDKIILIGLAPGLRNVAHSLFEVCKSCFKELRHFNIQLWKIHWFQLSTDCKALLFSTFSYSTHYRCDLIQKLN